jgi:hypothetical protein
MKLALKTIIVSIAVFVTLAGTAAAEGMPDILGIALGMPVREAYAKLQADLPKNKADVRMTNLPTIEKPIIASLLSEPQQAIGIGMEADYVKVYVTLPPTKQAVWRVERTRLFPDKGIAKAKLQAALRGKYGKETVAWHADGTPTTDDDKVMILVWLFDEHGRPRTLPSNMSISNCVGLGDPSLAETSVPSYTVRNWCHTSYIGVVAIFSTSKTPELYDQMTVTMFDLPSVLRAGDATVKWKKEIAEGAHKRDLEKGKQQDEPKL